TDFEKLLHFMNNVIGTSCDEGAFQVVYCLERARSRLHPEFLFIGIREKAFQVHFLNRGLTVLIDARDRNAAFVKTRLALRLGPAAKLFNTLAISGESDAAGQPAIAILQRAANGRRCGSRVPDFKFRWILWPQADVMKVIELFIPSKRISDAGL